jgi:hypothetical protein
VYPSQHEIAFNHEPGYLLGESVWNYFNHEPNLIYCERLSGSKEALLVIIKSGTVYLDTRVSIDNLGEELIALRSQKTKYTVYLFGDVPISENPSTTKFFFDAASIQSFNTLTESVFEQLPLDSSVKLLPLNEALSSSGINGLSWRPIVTTLAVLVALYAGYHFLSTHKKSLPKILVGVVDPYERFVETLSSPAPTQEINAFVGHLETLYKIPGASLKTITLSNTHAMSSLINPNNVSLSELNHWSTQHHFSLLVNNQGVHINTLLHTSNRTSPKNIYKLQNILRILIDRLQSTLPGIIQIKLSEHTQFSEFKEVEISLTFSNITPGTLRIVSNTLKDLPINFNTLETTINHGLISGTLKLTIVGN